MRRGGPGRRGEFRCAGRGWDGGGGGWPRSSSSSPGGLRRGAAETRGPAPPLLLPLLPPSAAGPLPALPPLRPSHRGQLARRPPRRCALGPDRLRARGPRPAGPCPARPLAAHPAPRAALTRPVARPAVSPSPGPLFFPPRPPSLSGPLCPRCLGALLAPLLSSAASASPVPGVALQTPFPPPLPWVPRLQSSASTRRPLPSHHRSFPRFPLLAPIPFSWVPRSLYGTLPSPASVPFLSEVPSPAGHLHDYLSRAGSQGTPVGRGWGPDLSQVGRPEAPEFRLVSLLFVFSLLLFIFERHLSNWI